jgi:hypothetical protein
MVQLRVDVEAANARRAFQQTSRAVDDLGDQLTQAEIDAVRLEDAMDDTAREAARLRAEVARLGSSAPQQLRDDLLAAERAAVMARIAFQRADGAVDDLERSLAEARREAARLEREMNDLDRSAGRSFRNIQRGFLQAGHNSGGVFAAGLANAPVAAAAAGLAAVLGGAINAALLAGVGGGVLAAGVAIAAKNSDAVQKAFRDEAIAPMAKDVKAFAAEFEDELISAAVTFGNAWSRVSGSVGEAFAKADDFIEPLVGGLADMIEKVAGGDGFAHAMEAAGPVIDQIGVGLSRTGDALDSFFDSLGDGGDGAVKGMIIIFGLLTGAIRLTGNVIEFLSKALDEGTEFAQRYADVYEKMLGWIPGIGDAWEYAAETLGLFNDEAGKTSDIMPIAGVTAEDASGNIYKVGEASEQAARDAHNLNRELNEFINQALTASGSAIAYERAIDELTASFQENGKSIDISNEKGRQNVEAIDAVVAAAKRKMESDIAAAGGEKATKEAVDAATAAYRAKVGQLEQQLLKLGLTKAQVDALLASYRDLSNAPNIYKTITYRVSASGPASLVNAAQQSGTYTGVGGRAAGGPVTAGTPYIVGERGPEMIVPDSNAMVYTAAETARMLAGGRGWAGGSAGQGMVNVALSIAPGAGHGSNPAVAMVIRMFRDRQIVLRDVKGQPVRLAGA